jgi:hypothetical protein
MWLKGDLKVIEVGGNLKNGVRSRCRVGVQQRSTVLRQHPVRELSRAYCNDKFANGL